MRATISDAGPPRSRPPTSDVGETARALAAVERAGAPALVAGHVRVHAHHERARRLGQVHAELGAALDDRGPLDEGAVQQVGAERGRLLLARPGRGADALDLEGQDGEDEGEDARVGLAAVLEDGAAGRLPRDGQRRGLELAAGGEQPALLVARAGGDRQDGAAAVGDHQTGVERPCDRARQSR
jgi:hypothetical protein